MERIIKRGDIYYAELNPIIGSEQGGTRPVLIISNDIGNKHSPTVIIAAITSRVHTKAKLPTHTAVSNYEGLDKDSIILLEQIRTIDKQRLKQYMGMMPDNIMARVDKALAITLSGINPIYCFSLCLSIVRICSSRMMESLSSPSKSFTSVCVGNFAFVCTRLVIAATITVGLCLFPISLEMISTGLVPPCSEPTTGFKSA